MTDKYINDVRYITDEELVHEEEVGISTAQYAREIIRLRKLLDKADDILWPVLWYADDVEHYTTCHADTLPQLFGKLAKAIVDAREAIQYRPEIG